MQLPSFVWVINTGKATHQDRYNGEEFNFYANDPVLIPEEVAFTLFGFGEDNKSRCLLRLGWIQSNDASTFDKGLQKLARFHIERAVFAPPTGLQPPGSNGDNVRGSAQGADVKTPNNKAA